MEKFNLAIIADQDFEDVFDKLMIKDGYKSAQLSGKNCAFLKPALLLILSKTFSNSESAIIANLIFIVYLSLNYIKYLLHATHNLFHVLLLLIHFLLWNLFLLVLLPNHLHKVLILVLSCYISLLAPSRLSYHN